MKKFNLLLLAFGIMTVVAWCGNSWSGEPVKSGDQVSVNYIGRTTDGKVFDTSLEQAAKDAGLFNTGRTYEPLKFVVSGGQMIPGFDKWVVGMKKGETKVIKFGPDEGYGQADPKAVITTGLNVFVQAGITPEEIKEWAMFNFGGANGKITKIDWENITIDFNFELAGKDLEFEVTMVEISSNTGSVAPTAAN